MTGCTIRTAIDAAIKDAEAAASKAGVNAKAVCARLEKEEAEVAAGRAKKSPPVASNATEGEVIVARALRQVLSLLDAGQGQQQVVDALGSSCILLNSIQTPIHAACEAEAGRGRGAGYAAGTRQALSSGGCNASRSLVAGALLGARYGVGEGSGREGVPASWVARTDVGEEAMRLAGKLGQDRAMDKGARQ